MHNIRKLITWGGAVLCMLMVSGIYFIWKNADKIPLTDIEESSQSLYEELQKEISNTQTIFNFVEERLPYGYDILYGAEIVTVPDAKPPTREDLHRAVLNNFSMAIQHNDMDLFLNAITSDSINQILNGEGDIDKRIEIFSETIGELNRNGLLEKVTYQFHIEKYNKEGNSGILNLIYTDGKSVEVPFELELYGEDDERFYQITTSIIEMIALINSEN